MATRQPRVPLGDDPADAAMQQSPWRKTVRLSSLADGAETMLAQAGFDRGPWLAIAFAGGIAAWFGLARPVDWVLAASAYSGLALGALALWRGNPARQNLTTACVAFGLLGAAGIGMIWARSTLVGAPALERPLAAHFDGRVLERIEQPAEGRVRLVLAMREPGTRRRAMAARSRSASTCRSSRTVQGLSKARWCGCRRG
jgi:competence protein ComEC